MAVCKRVLKEDLTTNPDKHREYLTDLVQTYNDIIRYVGSIYSGLDEKSKKTFHGDWDYLIGKVRAFFDRLNVTLPAPPDRQSLLTVGIVIENYNFNNPQVSNQESSNSEPSPGTSQETVVTQDTSNSNSDDNTVAQDAENPRVVKNIVTRSTQTSELTRSAPPILSDTELFVGFSELFYSVHNMATTAEKMEYLRAAAQTVRQAYGGDPLTLASFVSSVRLLKSVTEDKFKEVFLEFVKTKLEGKALECIPPNPDTIDAIIEALERNIKPDNSKVVAGRLLALKPDKSKLTEFTEQTEKLADALQRSLTLEGISQAKALEMTIEKTVEVCRNAARTDLVKAVLASTQFQTPKEVVAKYIVESATEEKEKQILAYHSYKRQNKKNSNNYNNRNQKNGFRGRGNRNGGNGRNFNNNNGRNYSNNNGNNSRNDNGNQNGNRNNNNNNNNRNNRGGWNNGGYRSNNGDNRNVRYTENYDGPQVQLGAPHNQN